MLMARYGGGVSMGRITEILNMPMATVVRLIGVAVQATAGERGKDRKRGGESEKEMADLLDNLAKRQGLKT